MSSRQLCSFFSEVSSGEFKCNICDRVRRQAPRSGYSNSLGHLVSKHPSHQLDYADFQRRSLTTIEVFGFAYETTTNMYDWMRWVVERNAPLSDLECKLTRQLVKMRPINPASLKRCVQLVAERVGQKISRSVHYVATFGVYHVGEDHSQRLLAVSPMEDGLTADAHIEYLESILGVYDKQLSMVKFLVTDNCSTNQSIASKMRVPLIGCASHHFNLGVMKVLSEHEDLVSQIQNMMIQLGQQNLAAQLARHTELRLPKSNATRWSSTYAMIDRYKIIRDAIMKVSAVEELVPRGAVHRRVFVLHAKLEELDSVCKKLQYEVHTLAEVRLRFDACIEKHPLTKEHLSTGT